MAGAAGGTRVEGQGTKPGIECHHLNDPLSSSGPGSRRPAAVLAGVGWISRRHQAVCKHMLLGTNQMEGMGLGGCFLWLMGQLSHLDRWHSRGQETEASLPLRSLALRGN